jgi:hypothetical protein
MAQPVAVKPATRVLGAKSMGNAAGRALLCDEQMR